MKKWVYGAALLALGIPGSLFAASEPLLYTGWLPSWAKESGALEVLTNIDKLDGVSPFSYDVQKNGTLKDVLELQKNFWPSWLSVLKGAQIKIIPTVALFNSERMYALLSNTKKRRAHEDLIAHFIIAKGFDGVDIDYENISPKTQPFFSLFLQGLSLRLKPHNKIISCTIESRPILSLLYADPLEQPREVTDYTALNRYCNEVRIMAYDQSTIDDSLNTEKGNGNLYAPVADPLWVEKIVQEALKNIDKKKIVLGIPTYGYEYRVSWNNGTTTYRRLRALTYESAIRVARELGQVPTRNNAGELSFVYASSTTREVSSGLRFNVSSSLPGILALQGNVPAVHFTSFNDAESVAQKIALAKKYSLRGAALFKLDGKSDPQIWERIGL